MNEFGSLAHRKNIKVLAANTLPVVPDTRMAFLVELVTGVFMSIRVPPTVLTANLLDEAITGVSRISTGNSPNN